MRLLGSIGHDQRKRFQEEKDHLMMSLAVYGYDFMGLYVTVAENLRGIGIGRPGSKGYTYFRVRRTLWSKGARLYDGLPWINDYTPEEFYRIVHAA